jgi:hypothetical protein
LALPPLPTRAAQTPAATPRPASDARAAAQRAFFDAALAKSGVTAPTAGPQSRALQPATTRLTDETPVRPHPDRPLRPGSLVDITV